MRSEPSSALDLIDWVHDQQLQHHNAETAALSPVASFNQHDILSISNFSGSNLDHRPLNHLPTTAVAPSPNYYHYHHLHNHHNHHNHNPALPALPTTPSATPGAVPNIPADCHPRPAAHEADYADDPEDVEMSDSDEGGAPLANSSSPLSLSWHPAISPPEPPLHDHPLHAPIPAYHDNHHDNHHALPPHGSPPPLSTMVAGPAPSPISPSGPSSSSSNSEADHDPDLQSAPPPPPPLAFGSGASPLPFQSNETSAPTVVPGPPNSANPVLDQLQPTQLDDAQNDDEDGNDDAGDQGSANVPLEISGLNHGVLGPENPGLLHFLSLWATPSRFMANYNRPGRRAPTPARVAQFAASHVRSVEYDDLNGNACDMQGVDWSALGVSRSEARERRLTTYKNYTNQSDSDLFSHMYPDRLIPATESFFRFRRMHVRQNVHLSHFQLRNVLASTSRSQSFYPGVRGVRQIDPVSGNDQLAMDLTDLDGVPISTIAANCGLLVAGTFTGEYCLRRLDTDDVGYTEGRITGSYPSGITNHIQIHESRGSSGPMVAFASNDQGFRVLDVGTERFVSKTMYSFPMNCTVLSPDRRLRAMVGDNCDVLITHADTGEVLQSLSGHRDYGFSCDWADDGWTVATGFQDMAVKIWDARRWCNSNGKSTPVCTIRSEMAGVRNLRFSPVGSGRRVLVAAEEADYVNIIDARTYAQKQSFDIFGEIGGLAFANNGQDLQILCCDRERGGLIQLERTSLGAEAAESARAPPPFPYHYKTGRPDQENFDWTRSAYETVLHPRTSGSLTYRRRQAASQIPMAPF